MAPVAARLTLRSVPERVAVPVRVATRKPVELDLMSKPGKLSVALAVVALVDTNDSDAPGAVGHGAVDGASPAGNVTPPVNPSVLKVTPSPLMLRSAPFTGARAELHPVNEMAPLVPARFEASPSTSGAKTPAYVPVRVRERDGIEQVEYVVVQ